MISYGLADKLSAAGLDWKHLIKSSVWLSVLSDILAEIERRDYGWTLSSHYIKLRWWDSNTRCLEKEFIAATPEEAAGQALLWILKQEGER